jgi:Tol biopolymer transport system component
VVTAKNSLGGPYSLYSISLETGDDEKLTSPPAEFEGDVSPVFSPDGQTLAFVAYNDLYLLPLTSGQPKRLTASSWRSAGAWTADGGEIVFASSTGGTRQLWRVSASSAKTRALGIGANGTDLTISRHGNRLAYVEAKYDSDIWRIDLASSPTQGIPPSRLIQSSQEDANPLYSPDGKNIVFNSNRSGSVEIWICDSEGRNGRPLTSFPETTVTGSPRWSPDGRQIAFDSWENGRPNIFVVSPEGGSPRCLTEKTDDAFLPSWSRDGCWIYFCSNRSGDRQQIWRMPAEVGRLSA